MQHHLSLMQHHYEAGCRAYITLWWRGSDLTMLGWGWTSAFLLQSSPFFFWTHLLTYVQQRLHILQKQLLHPAASKVVSSTGA